MSNNADDIFDIENDECYQYVTHFKNAKRFLSSFRKKYCLIIAYHSTNIDDREYELIRLNGLKGTNGSFLKEKAINRFIYPTDPSKIKKEAQKIIDDFFKSKKIITEGEVNFVIDKRLIDESYHYLLFGPESLLPLADTLKQKLNLSFRQRMVEFGKPTILTSPQIIGTL